MCWVMTVGGQFSGKAREHRHQRLDPAGRRADRHDPPSPRIECRARADGRGCRLARGAHPRAGGGLHLGQISYGRSAEQCRGVSAAWRRNRRRRAPAPPASPRRRLWVRVDTMITGIGRSRMIFSRNSMPFMFGISTSSVITSGLSALIVSRASMRIAGAADHLDLGIAAQAARDQAAHGGRSRRRPEPGPASCARPLARR